MAQAKEPTAPLVVGFRSEHRIFEVCSTEKDPPRPILAGVFLDPASGYLVASNGYILAATPFEFEGKFPKGFKGCVVPGSVLREGYKAHPAQGVWIPLYLDLETKTAWTDSKTGGTASGNFINGTYPEWQTLIPEKASFGNRKAQNYDVGYLTRIFQAIGLSKSGQLQLSKDDGPSLTVGTDGAFGFLMPVRSVEPDKADLARIFKLRPKAKPLKAAA